MIESLLPLLMVQYRFDLALSGILGVIITFIILDPIFWRYYARLIIHKPLYYNRGTLPATISAAYCSARDAHYSL